MIHNSWRTSTMLIICHGLIDKSTKLNILEFTRNYRKSFLIKFYFILFPCVNLDWLHKLGFKGGSVAPSWGWRCELQSWEFYFKSSMMTFFMIILMMCGIKPGEYLVYCVTLESHRFTQQATFYSAVCLRVFFDENKPEFTTPLYLMSDEKSHI